MVGPIDVKRKGYILGIICDLDFDLTHDLDLGCFKVKFRNSFILGMGRLIDMERKGYESSFMTMILTSATMVGWADVPDIDRGDFSGLWPFLV